MPSAFQVARTKRASRVLKEKLTGRFQSKKTTHVAAGVGSRAVTIDGRLFPSSDEVSVSNMVNVGRPAAARYAPESGGGGGGAVVVGGGGGSSSSSPGMADYLRLDGTSVMIGDLNVGGQDILNVNEINGTSVDELIDNSHERLHDILSTDDHEITAPKWTLLGASSENTLGGLVPSADGRTEQILKSSSVGGLRLETLISDTSITTPVISSSGDILLEPALTSNSVIVSGLLTGGFGASSTGGTEDWNDISNARSGQGYTLLQGNDTNGPSDTVGTYFHPFGFEYDSKDGTGNITQLAIPYGYETGINAGIWMRGRFSSSWTDWVRLISENTNGSVGINTLMPSSSYKLDIFGNARATGTVYANTQVLTPKITTATDEDLLIDPAGNGIVLFPTSQTVGSVDFGSSFPIEGWRIYEFDGIDGKSGLTIGSITADELFIKYFVADETRIRRGQQYWTYSNGIISRAFTTPTAIDGTVRLYFENSPALAGAIFVNGDWLLIQYISNAGGGFVLQNIWGQVSSYSTDSYSEEDGEQSWLFTLKSGPTEVEINKGAEAIDFGQTGAALIQLSVVDAAGSPYIDMRRWAGSDPMSPSNHTSLVKIGDLDGISNSYVTPNGDGLYIRSGASADQFIVADDNGLQLRGANFSQYNGSEQTVLIESDDGSMTLGTDISDPDQVGFAFDGTSGDVTIGNPSYASTVTVYGQIYIANPSDIDTSDLTNDAGWTSGATWGTNLGNIPDRFGESPDEAGLYLTGTHLGYYDGAAWKAWMAATGEFYFGGSSGAHLQWSGRYLRGIGSDSTVKWFADSEDGVFYFGGGAGWLDEDGININVVTTGTPDYLRFMSGGSVYGSIGFLRSTGPTPDANDGLIFNNAETTKFRFTGASATEFEQNVYVDGFVEVTGDISVGGTVDGVNIAEFKTSFDEHDHNSSYLQKSGGTLTGTLNSRNIIPTADDTYNVGGVSNRIAELHVVELYADTIVGTPSYEHQHTADEITSGVFDDALLPNTQTGKSFISSIHIDADGASTTYNYIRWKTNNAESKRWDLIAYDKDHATPSLRDDMQLTWFDGSSTHSVFTIDNATQVLDFDNTPTVSGTAISVVGHDHNTLYYTEDEIDSLLDSYLKDDGSTVGAGSQVQVFNSGISTSLIESSGDIDLSLPTEGNSVHVGGLLTGGLGARATTGTVDWNHSSNARSGQGYTLLKGDSSNGPSRAGSRYFHPLGFVYSSKGSGGNITQLAVPYGRDEDIDGGIWMRGRFSSTWSDWVRVISENTNGSVGINTLSPSAAYALDVNGDTHVTGSIEIDDTVYAETSLETPLITTPSSEDLLISPSGDNVVIDAFVGIGESFSVESLLHVQTTSSAVSNFIIIEGDRNAGDTEVGILFKDRSAVSGGQEAGRIFTRRQATSGHFDLVFQTGNQIAGGLGDELLTLNGQYSRVGIKQVSPSYDLDVSGNARATGTVYANTQVLTPKLTTATNDDLLIDPAGTGLVLFPTSQTVGSVDFGSSFPIEGWRIYEFDGITGKNGLTIGSITADELFIKYFVADETRIRRGQQYWTYSNGTLSRAFTTPTAIDGTVRLYFENSPQIDGAIFVSGDWLLVQYISNAGGGFILQNIWGQVSDYATTGNGEESGEQSWLFTLKAGLTEVEVGKGAEAIDFGQTGAALIQLSVVDATGAPYIDMRRWAGSDPISPSNHTSLVKIGDLDGISNSYVTPNGDGIYIRSGAAANQFIVADDNGLQLRGADFSQYNDTSQTVLIESNDGSLTLGTDLSDPDQVGISFDGTSGNVTIGNPNYASTVTVYGQIYIANPSDIDTSALTNDAGWTAGATWGSNIGNQPTQLGDINSSEGTKLSGIAAGATVGATWGTNLNSIPTRFGDAPSSAGLYLTPTHLGYYNGAAWKAWIASSGQFYFGGDSGAHLEWSGRYLQGIGTDGTTEQWFADSQDGRLYFGAGAGWLDADGLTINVGDSAASSLSDANKISWVSGVGGDSHFWISATETLATTEAILWAADPEGDTTQITAIAEAGAGNNALITLQATVNSISSQWTFNRLGGGDVYASFPGYLQVNDVRPGTDEGGDLGAADLYYDHAFIRNLHIDTIVGTPTYAHEHDAEDITDGEFDLARIPTNLSGKNADMLDGLHSTAFATAGHNHTGVYSPVGHDHAGVYSPVGHDHDGIYSPIGHDHDSDYLSLSGGTLTGSLEAPWIKNAVIGQPSQTSRDMSMVGYFDRNELVYANYSGSVTVSVTGAYSGTTGESYFVNGTGLHGSIDGTDGTTTQIVITVDRGSLAPANGQALWQPFFAYRLATGGSSTWYNALTVEVSSNGSTWYKPSGGQWETSDFNSDESAYGLWLGEYSSPSIPGNSWRYARFTMTDRRENSSYPYKENVWIAHIGIRHVSAPFSRVWLDRAGDVMFGNFAVQTGGSNVFDVNVSSGTSTATGLFNVAGDATVTGDLNVDEDITVDGTITTTTILSPGDITIGLATVSNKLHIDGLLTGGFGTRATSGTLDWNHSSNARSGQGYTLLKGDSSNGPSRAGSVYFHPFGFEYLSKDSTGNITQLAVPYAYEAGINAGIWMRGRSSSVWSDWVRVISENTNGSVGVNTTNPSSSYKLDVNGDARVNGALTVGSAIVNAAAATSSATFAQSSFSDSNSFALAQYSSGATQLNGHDGQYVDIGTNGIATLTVSADYVNPRGNAQISMGDYNRKFSAIHGFELIVENLVAQDVMATIGGRIVVSDTSFLSSDTTQALCNTFYLDHNSYAPGEWLYLAAFADGSPQVEYVRVHYGPSGFGPYLYTVERQAHATNTTTLLNPMSNVATTMDTVANNLPVGGYVQLSDYDNSKLETVLITSGPSVISGGYRYAVTRNATTATAYAWSAAQGVKIINKLWVTGNAVVTTGKAVGNGYIELTSTETLLSQYGPTISITNRTDADIWNGLAEVVALGNLRSRVDYVADKYGLVVGNDTSLTPTTGFSGITADAADGVRMFNTDIRLHDSGTQTVNIDSTGTDFWIGTSSDNKLFVWNGTAIALRSNDTDTITLSASGNASIAGVVNLGSSGGIYQGTGTFASPTTGLKIWNNATDGEVTLFDDGTRVVWLNGSDGLNLTGNTLYSSPDVTRSLTFWNGSAIIGQLTSYIDSGGYGEGVELHAYSPNSDGGSRRLSLAAVSDDDDAILTLLASGSPGTVSVEMQAAGLITVAGAHINMSNKAITDLSVVEIGDDTLSIPYGKLKVAGAQTSNTGPHQYFVTSQDSRPTMQLFNWQHDNVAILFDMYYQTGWKASDTTGAQIYKLNDALKIRGHSSSTPGSTATMYDLVDIDIVTGLAEFAGDVSVAGDFEVDGELGNGWISPTFNTGWTNYGSNFTLAGYKKVGDIVFVHGMVKRTSGSETTMWTMPVGYRPQDNVIEAARSASGDGEVRILDTGAVVMQAGSATWFAFNVWFSTLT